MKQFLPEPIFVHSMEELEQVFKNFQKQQNIQFNCIVCGNTSHRLIKKFLKNKCGLLCPKCLHDQTCMEKYGFTSAMKVKEIANKSKNWLEDPEKIKARNEKSKKTCLEKWGVENPFQSEIIKEKIKQTNLKKIGVENPAQSEEIQSKIIQTNLERWGCERPAQNKDVVEKAKQTCLENHGVEYPMQSEIVQEKSKKTCLEKYGVENVFQSEIIQAKQQQTLLERYNVTNPTYLWANKTPEEKRKIRIKSIKKYKCGNQFFDSSWELAVWIWATDLGKDIKREPVNFEYEFKNQTHTYFPDFEIDGQLVEVKGDQFFKEDGTMQNPFDHSLDNLFEAKHQCGLRNGVQFWRRKEMGPILNYIEEKYGKKYLNLFLKES